MSELHSSPHQRLMIAEINKAYQPALVLLDGVEALVNGGPEAGKQVKSNVILAGTDRVAVDVVASSYAVPKATGFCDPWARPKRFLVARCGNLNKFDEQLNSDLDRLTRSRLTSSRRIARVKRWQTVSANSSLLETRLRRQWRAVEVK